MSLKKKEKKKEVAKERNVVLRRLSLQERILLFFIHLKQPFILKMQPNTISPCVAYLQQMTANCAK